MDDSGYTKPVTPTGQYFLEVLYMYYSPTGSLLFWCVTLSCDARVEIVPVADIPRAVCLCMQ